MAFDPDPGGPDERGDACDFLIVSDLHLDWGEDGQDDIEYAKTVTRRINSYGEEYGCDGLLVAGDVGSTENLEDLYDELREDFEEIKIAQGNHDVNGREIAERVNHVPTDDYDTCVETTTGKTDDLLVQMKHDPSDFGLNYRKQESRHSDHERPDILVYGHSHMPFDRVLSDGTLAIGAGSTYDNYNMEDHFPTASFHVLGFDEAGGDEHVTVEHRDFWSQDIHEEAVYRWDDDGFSKVFSDWEWDALARDEDRFTIPS